MLALMSSTEGIIFGSGQFQRHDRGGFVLAERNGPSKGCSPCTPHRSPGESPCIPRSPWVPRVYPCTIRYFPVGGSPFFG